MVDFRKRAAKALAATPYAAEQVLAAVNVTPSPFRVLGGGATGGAIAGGVVGAVVGAAWDKRTQDKEARDAETRSLPAVAGRTPVEPAIPANGGLLAVTTHRVAVWKISGMGKPRDLLVQVPIEVIDEVVWEHTDTKWLSGATAAQMMWVGAGDEVLAAAAIAMGPATKYARGVVEALETLRPGRVAEFTQ